MAVSEKEVQAAALKKKKLVEGSKAEEATESPSFERAEDAHEETAQIKPGTARHSALMAAWKAPSKSGGKNLSPKPGTGKKNEFLK